MVECAFADEVLHAGKFCATIARARVAHFHRRRFIPTPRDDTATVSFVKFEGKTYAVTARHVIEAFAAQAAAEGIVNESYFLPAAPGVELHPTFISPPAQWPDKDPDIALRQIDDDLSAYIGKEAFPLMREPKPEFPIRYAAAIGFPTLEKSENKSGGVSMRGVHAIAEGVGSREDADQLQFFSELFERVPVSSLSGVSGGPVFWSDGEHFGLIGFVKQALDVNPVEGEQTIYAGPRVSFVCQRTSFDLFARWAEYANTEMPKRREVLNRWAEAQMAKTKAGRQQPNGNSAGS